VSSDRVLDATLTTELLASVSARPVIVLERLPRAAGRTRWFRCETPSELRTVLDVLTPASRVSFYFDGRIAERRRDAQLTDTVARLIAEHSEIVVGTLSADGIELEVDFPSSAREVDEQLDLAGSRCRGFVGPFPAPDNDGSDAITALVPDPDGSVRREPH